MSLAWRKGPIRGFLLTGALLRRRLGGGSCCAESLQVLELTENDGIESKKSTDSLLLLRRELGGVGRCRGFRYARDV